MVQVCIFDRLEHGGSQKCEDVAMEETKEAQGFGMEKKFPVFG